MSGRYVSLVLESDLAADLKFTAVVYASFADDVDGTQIYPSVPYVAHLRGIQERSVQYHVKELQQMEILEVFRPATQWLPTHYRMRLDKLPTRAPYKAPERQRSMLDPAGESPPGSDAGVHSTAPLPGVQPNVAGVHWNVSGVQPSAPDPSSDPSSDPSVHTCTPAREATAATTGGESPRPFTDAEMAAWPMDKVMSAEEAAAYDAWLVRADAPLPLIVAPRRDPDHAAHAWCHPRICVPKFLHKQLKQALGGQVTKRAARMRAFYAETLDAIPAARPIEPDPVKFWRSAFAARFGQTARKDAPARHEGNMGREICPHEPQCGPWPACRDRTLAEARAERQRQSG